MTQTRQDPEEQDGPTEEKIELTKQIEEELYFVISHEIRRLIIKQIGENGYTSFSKIKASSKASTGVIYHHLKSLEKYIYQDAKKKYHLTEQGEKIYQIIESSTEAFISDTNIPLETEEPVDNEELPVVTRVKSREERNFSRLYSLFTFQGLISFVREKPLMQFLFSTSFVFIAAILTGLAEFSSTFYFFFPSPAEQSLRYYILVFMVAYLLLIILVDLIANYLFDSAKNLMDLSRWLGFTYLPSLLYLIIYHICVLINFSALIEYNLVIMVLFQVWSLIIAVDLIHQIKGISVERALIIMILINYGVFLVILISNYIPL